MCSAVDRAPAGPLIAPGLPREAKQAHDLRLFQFNVYWKTA